jgi:hypothetical protein
VKSNISNIKIKSSEKTVFCIMGKYYKNTKNRNEIEVEKKIKKATETVKFSIFLNRPNKYGIQKHVREIQGYQQTLGNFNPFVRGWSFRSKK